MFPICFFFSIRDWSISMSFSQFFLLSLHTILIPLTKQITCNWSVYALLHLLWPTWTLSAILNPNAFTGTLKLAEIQNKTLLNCSLVERTVANAQFISWQIQFRSNRTHNLIRICVLSVRASCIVTICTTKCHTPYVNVKLTRALVIQAHAMDENGIAATNTINPYARTCVHIHHDVLFQCWISYQLCEQEAVSNPWDAFEGKAFVRIFEEKHWKRFFCHNAGLRCTKCMLHVVRGDSPK